MTIKFLSSDILTKEPVEIAIDSTTDNEQQQKYQALLQK